jgi:hypothetical protein
VLLPLDLQGQSQLFGLEELLLGSKLAELSIPLAKGL